MTSGWRPPSPTRRQTQTRSLTMLPLLIDRHRPLSPANSNPTPVPDTAGPPDPAVIAVVGTFGLFLVLIVWLGFVAWRTIR